MKFLDYSSLLAVTVTVVQEQPKVLGFLAGIGFAAWPITQKFSGLYGLDSPLAFALLQAAFLLFFFGAWMFYTGYTNLGFSSCIIGVIVILFTHIQWGKAPGWNYAIAGSIASGFGLLCITQMLTISTLQNLGINIAVVICTQTIITAIAHVAINPDQFSIGKCVGVAAILIGAVYVNTK